jgi:hypothetical protein
MVADGELESITDCDGVRELSSDVEGDTDCDGDSVSTAGVSDSDTVPDTVRVSKGESVRETDTDVVLVTHADVDGVIEACRELEIVALEETLSDARDDVDGESENIDLDGDTVVEIDAVAHTVALEQTVAVVDTVAHTVALEQTVADVDTEFVIDDVGDTVTDVETLIEREEDDVAEIIEVALEQTVADVDTEFVIDDVGDTVTDVETLIEREEDDVAEIVVDDEDVAESETPSALRVPQSKISKSSSKEDDGMRRLLHVLSHDTRWCIKLIIYIKIKEISLHAKRRKRAAEKARTWQRRVRSLRRITRTSSH